MIFGGIFAAPRGTVSDRAILFLFSVLVEIASLAAAGWLLVTGQAGSVDGLFLFLTCLLVALAFGLFLVFMIRRAMEPVAAPAPQSVKAGAAAPAQKPAPVTQG
jgi:NAD/NADP transhydrogenase beta subunit